MNIDTLKQKVKAIIDDKSSFQMYLVFKNQENYELRKADLDNGNTTESIKSLFVNRLYGMIVNDDAINACKLSMSDDRANVIYEYDFDEYPDDISFFTDFDIHQGVNMKKFSFKNDEIKNLYGYLLYIGHIDSGILLFKKYYPISLIRRSNAVLLVKSNKRLVELNDDIIRLDPKFQMMKIHDTVFITDLKMFESKCGFHKLIQRRANETIDAIEETGLVEDISKLRDETDDISFTKKLSKVRDTSPILTKNIPNDKIILFSKTHPGLKDKLRYTKDDRQIKLNTKAARNYFVKLLNDDYLTSQLTEQFYDSLAKDKVQ